MTLAPPVHRERAAPAVSPAPPPLRRRETLLFLGVMAVAVLALTIGPLWLQTSATAVIVVGSFWALIRGTRRNAIPGCRAPWWAMIVAATLFIGAVVVRLVVPGADASPPGAVALIPNLMVLPAYAAQAWAYAQMLRRRRAVEDDPAGTDALLVGLTSAYGVWTLLIVPALGPGNETLVYITNLFFPVIDVMLLVLVTQLALAGGARAPSLWLLLGGSGLMFTGDTLYALSDGQLADVPMHLIDVLFMASLAVFGAATLHPSMRTLTEAQSIEVRRLNPFRITAIALLVILPQALTAFLPPSSLLDSLVRAVLCVLLIVTVFVRVVRSNNSRAQAERASRHRATHDVLTDLPNRELLAETVAAWGERAATEEQEISLLFIDLDRFKMVNDHWGHRVGDELLCQVAGRLAGHVREGDLVCRIGGDEFVIALSSRSHSRVAESLADRVLAALARPFDLSVGSVVISASIGVAKAVGGTQALELIRDADTAMYKAKGSGRNGYALFDTSLRDRVRDRVRLEQALRGALDRGELAVYYQPIVDLESDELDGFEALMRWQSPELGFVSPMDFIPIAEETGLIVEVGAWLLRDAVRELVRWTERRPDGARRLHVSVNVSVRQLRGGALVRTVRDTLAETGLPPEALWLEITESGVMEDVDTALQTLNELRDLGVTLCVDDFGTGYSSLSYLHRLPVGIVKIDRSFVAGVGEDDSTNEPIVRAVLAMTHAMGQRVVAEGVETAVQRDWLRAQDCDLVQGWFYGKPEPPARLEDWLRRDTATAG
ncbi:putative bifunctional diguanylate cyclase/phosphodiesterase [Mangrovihabitans endophyticus]|uniref:Diguanylate cyclase (GGDEF) domain-containing protein n=1 Tax=Mangrovihabitans endophyticus TaxID=1751298 RepID=A0A8J3FM42_9ACTN|nr:EAL domain-containing protein [Mangrovihabitans endophyticus]GGK81071.1 hypothetical protein GCM10012284_13760 [Mangrovihabitans endophyticus]